MKFEELFNRKKKRSIKKKIEEWWSYTKTYRIEIPYYDFINGVKNIFKWWKIIVKDRDWDHHYIIEVLRFKINNTANYIEKAQHHLNWEQDVKYMRIACKLIDKLWGDYTVNEENYESEYSKYQESDYSWSPADENERDALADKADQLVKSINRNGKIDEILNDIEFIPLNIDEVEQELEDEYMEDYEGDLLMNIKEISENFDEYFAENKLMHKKAIEYLRKNRSWSNPTSKYTQAMVISKLKHDKAKKLLFKILEEKLENWWS